jgi:predicted metal-dependent hydrolase
VNGPEHFAEAERLLEAAKADVRSLDDKQPGRMLVLDRASIAIAAAGVHAKLAEAAAINERVRAGGAS